MSMITAKDIGQLMRKERKHRDMTQGELAQALGVSQSSVSKFENGQLIPSAIEWLIFCQIFNLSMRWCTPSMSSASTEANNVAVNASA